MPCKQIAGAPKGGTAKCASNCLAWDKSTCYEDSNESSNPGENGNKANCGNGFLDDGEECDDGNKMDGDGCSKYCMKENGNSSKQSGSSGCAITVF
jgi:cysteine-rich repeat protein